MPSIPRSAAEHGIERVAWSELGPEVIRAWGWPNGKHEPEHLTVYGRSGGGKTYFVRELVAERARRRGSAVIFVATKRADRTVTELGWPVIKDWPPGYGEKQVIYWAKAKGISAEHRVPQRVAVKRLMDALWAPNANTIVVWDELTYIERNLRLKTELETFYREGRSHGLTNVATMQRPSNVTRLAHSEAGWTVAFPPKDQDDRRRVAEVFGDRARYQLVLADLDSTRREFVIKHDVTQEAYISHLPRRRAAQPADSRGRPARVRSVT